MTVAEMYAVARAAARHVHLSQRDDAVQDAMLALLRWPPPNKGYARLRARWGIKEGQRAMPNGGVRYPRGVTADQRPYFDSADEEDRAGLRRREPCATDPGFDRIDARLDIGPLLDSCFSPRSRAVFVLRDGMGWTNIEIGRWLGVDPSRVSQIYHGSK